MSLRKRVSTRRPDRAGPPDTALVSKATALVELRDFDFFRAAWHSWYGTEGETRTLERAFATYLFDSRAPSYVRHFARRILEAAALGRLDPVSFGITRYPRREALPDLRDRHAAAFMGGALLVCTLLLF